MTRFGSAVARIDVREPGSTLPLLSVSQTRGVIRRSEISDKPPRAETLDVYKVCREGDVVFNKMSIRAGAMGVALEDGLVTYHYEVMRPRVGTDARYVVYLMKSDWFTGELIARERGIGAGDQGGSVRTTEVPFKVLRTIDAYIPPPAEQVAIADFLDRETAQIDTLIAKQEQLIETLRERAAAAWANLFTRATQLGTILPLRRLVSSLVDGPFGSSLTASHYTDSGTRVIRLGNIGINEFRGTDQAYISDEYGAELEAHAVVAGDVVIAGLGDDRMPLGRAAVVPELGPAIVKADCYRARPNPFILPEYLAWSLSAPQTRWQVALLARGATRARLNTRVVQQVQLPVPEKPVQRKLLETSRGDARNAERLIAKAEEFITLAKERRAALITAAVTGQVEVSKAA